MSTASGHGLQEGYLKTIARNALISAGGKAVSFFTGPITAIITTRALGADLYGIYSLANYWTSLLADIARLGFGGSLLRFTATYNGAGRTDKTKGAIFLALKVSLAAGGIFTVGMIIFAGQFAGAVLKRPDVAAAFRFFSLAIIFTAVYGCFISALTGFKEQRYVVLANTVIPNMVKLITLVMLLFLGLRLYAALASSLLQDIAILGLGAWFLLKVFPQMRSRSLVPVTEKKELWNFSGTVFATSLFNRHARQMDVIFLGMFRPMHEVGLYTVATRLQPLIYMPHQTIMQIFGPVVAELYSRNETEKIKPLYKTVTKWTASLSMPVFMSIIFFYDPILAIFGKEYRGAAAALLIMGVGSVLGDMFGMSGQVITMIGRPAVNLANSVITAAISVPLYILLIPRWGIIGAAAAYSSSFLLINAARVAQVSWLMRMQPLKASIWKTIAASAASAASVLLMRKTAWTAHAGYLWIAELVILWVVYMVVTRLLGFDAEDKVVIDAIKRRVRKYLFREGRTAKL